MKPVHAQTIDSFRAGTWRVMVVTEPGKLPVLQKTAGEMQTVDVPYAAGDALLSNDRDEVICGPMSLTGITDLAERILDGDQRAATDTRSLLALATAIIAFQIEIPAASHDASTPSALAAPSI